MTKPYKQCLETRDCLYCKTPFELRSANAKHCSEKCYNSAKRCRRYKLSYSEHQILDTQTNCSICGVQLAHYNYLEKKRARHSKHCIDHCHITGKVRGAICDECNRGLAAFKDKIQNFKNAIKYLKQDCIESKIVSLIKQAYEKNWITSKDGNISVVKDGIFYITPSGCRKHELSPLDIIKIPIVDGEIQLSGQKVSIEFKMHWFIQKYQKSGAVIHFHPTSVVAAMLANINLKKIHDYFPELNRFTKVGESVEAIFPGEERLALETFEQIKDYDIVGLKSHGVTSRGPTLEDAFEHIERLDHCCTMALTAGAFKEIK